MVLRKIVHTVGAVLLGAGVLLSSAPACAEGAPDTVVRWIVMKDPSSVEKLLPILKGSSAASFSGLTFEPNGNYLLVIGNRNAVDANIQTLRLLAFLMERPRAHLRLNVRVVQITGTRSTEVVQTADTIQSVVNTQRDQLLRTFANLEGYVMGHVRAFSPTRRGEPDAFTLVVNSLPSLGSQRQPLSVPALLLLATLDSEVGQAGRFRGSPDTRVASAVGTAKGAPQAPTDAQDLLRLKSELERARDWCNNYAAVVQKGSGGVQLLRSALAQSDCPLPEALADQLRSSLDVVDKLQPQRVQEQAERVLRALSRQLEERVQHVDAILRSAVREGSSPGAKGEPVSPRLTSGGLLEARSLSEETDPREVKILRTAATAAGNSPERSRQLAAMLSEYVAERRKVDDYMRSSGDASGPAIDFERLQRLEANLNLWLRHSSEAMAQSVEEEFYRHYNRQLRVLADRRFREAGLHQLLSGRRLDEVPDPTATLLAARDTDIYVSNTISMQCTVGQKNKVTAKVQVSLPEKQTAADRLLAAQSALQNLAQVNPSLNNAPTDTQKTDAPKTPLPLIDPSAVARAMIVGGEPIAVTDSLVLEAEPSIGFDASTVTLKFWFEQSLEPPGTNDNKKVVEDRVVSHKIGDTNEPAVITALSYEPMVLSTVTSSVSYTDRRGGVPVLRKVPGLGALLGDIPAPPFKEITRQRSVYQCSVIILEPVVIPTIEDLYVFHGGSVESLTASTTPSSVPQPSGGSPPGAADGNAGGSPR